MSELITDAMAETAAKARWDYERAESGDTTSGKCDTRPSARSTSIQCTPH